MHAGIMHTNTHVLPS
uniref:Uncharacterized protein n=1 Tax=Anguilla anguilla TaxID=7936 RepID=A0A0E9S4D4_ANGAN